MGCQLDFTKGPFTQSPYDVICTYLLGNATVGWDLGYTAGSLIGVFPWSGRISLVATLYCRPREGHGELLIVKSRCHLDVKQRANVVCMRAVELRSSSQSRASGDASDPALRYIALYIPDLPLYYRLEGSVGVLPEDVANLFSGDAVWKGGMNTV